MLYCGRTVIVFFEPLHTKSLTISVAAKSEIKGLVEGVEIVDGIVVGGSVGQFGCVLLSINS